MNQHPVPKALLELIGDMTVSFAILEFMIQGLFGSLIREHQRVGQILSAQLPFPRLLDATVSLYQDRHGEDSDYRQLKDLLRRAADIEQERNLITHSIWGASGAPDAITRIKITSRMKRGFQVRFEEYDAVKLRSFVDDIKTLDSEMLKLREDLIDKGKAVNAPFEKTW